MGWELFGLFSDLGSLAATVVEDPIHRCLTYSATMKLKNQHWTGGGILVVAKGGEKERNLWTGSERRKGVTGPAFQGLSEQRVVAPGYRGGENSPTEVGGVRLQLKGDRSLS
jgi:hypothetical protein